MKGPIQKRLGGGEDRFRGVQMGLEGLVDGRIACTRVSQKGLQANWI